MAKKFKNIIRKHNKVGFGYGAVLGLSACGGESSSTDNNAMISYASNKNISDVSSHIYYLSAGYSKASNTFAELEESKVDLVIINSLDPEKAALSNWETEPVRDSQQVQSIQGDNQKIVIASKGFGNFWPIAGQIETKSIQMTWDQDRDGVPDPDAPEWLGPVNTHFFPDINPIDAQFGNWAYNDKHPEYYVKYWDAGWISYINSHIAELAANGWNGIFLDVIASPVWLSDNGFTDDVYTEQQLADLTYGAIESVRQYIDENYPGFMLIINSSGVDSIYTLRPDIVSLVDALVAENTQFYSSVKTSLGGNPVNFGLEDANNHLTISSGVTLAADEYGVPILSVDSVEDSPDALTYLARKLSDVEYNGSINIDHLFRSGVTPYIQVETGTSQDDTMITAFDSRVMMNGLSGDDTLVGGSYADILSGGRGDDNLDGGDGEDIAVFLLNKNDYDVTVNVMGQIRVAAKSNVETESSDGTDTLTNIEMLSFNDLDVIVADLIL